MVVATQNPSGTGTTRTINEDAPFTFAVTDFGFTDPDGNAGRGSDHHASDGRQAAPKRHRRDREPGREPGRH